MNELWTVLVPFMADLNGMEEIVNHSDGLAIIDDCVGYMVVPGYPRHDPINVVTTDIRVGDTINGTRHKLLAAAKAYIPRYDPRYLILAAGPVSSMVGTDLEEVADELRAKYSLPVIVMKSCGHKTYDHGMSETFQRLAESFVTETAKRPGAVNVIGGSAIDWSIENAPLVRDYIARELMGRGMQVISNWGMDCTMANYKAASAASVNLVPTVSGLAAARYMEREFGTPYVAAAPLGRTWGKMVLDAVSGATLDVPQPTGDEAEVLIISEQLTANAVRATLRLDYGINNVKAASFGMMDKKLMEPGDVRLKGESDALSLVGSGKYKLIIADSPLRPYAAPGAHFIDLPCTAYAVVRGEERPILAGEGLNRWLEYNGL